MIKRKKVGILTDSFYDKEGKDLYRGGAERYFRDLALLLEKNDWDVTIYQLSNENFTRNYSSNIKVIGLNLPDIQQLNIEFHKQMFETDLIIYGFLDIAKPNIRKDKSIVICHGTYWDIPKYRMQKKQFKYLVKQQKSYQKKLLNLKKNLYKLYLSGINFISVDTNFINWLRSNMYGIDFNITYIPNYVDLSVFHPFEKADRTGLNILFPRRLEFQRGIELIIDIIEPLIHKLNQFDPHFIFCGEGSYRSNLESLFSQNSLIKEHTALLSFEFDEMNQIYNQSDIVIIPSIKSEGTSLACLEAMACGKPVIVSTVGGLPNLVLHGYNGLMITPNSTSLEDAIIKLSYDSSLRSEMGNNGIKVAKSFSKTIWEQRWLEKINCLMEEKE